jgi:FKBP-type peptidyl-prolyl cis-trans isomerase
MERGLKILEENVGAGAAAAKGDTVLFDLEIALNRGEIVSPREEVTCRIGQRRLIAGVEKSLEGMREGGYRKVRVSPHLGYREAGVPGKIPPDAVLLCSIWVTRVAKPDAERPGS